MLGPSGVESYFQNQHKASKGLRSSLEYAHVKYGCAGKSHVDVLGRNPTDIPVSHHANDTLSRFRQRIHVHQKRLHVLREAHEHSRHAIRATCYRSRRQEFGRHDQVVELCKPELMRATSRDKTEAHRAQVIRGKLSCIHRFYSIYPQLGSFNRIYEYFQARRYSVQ